MLLEIGRYRIRTKAHSILLEKHYATINRKTNEKNPPDWHTLGYYSTLPSALEGMLQHKTKSSEATSAKALLAELKELRDEVLAALSRPEPVDENATRRTRRPRNAR